MIRLALIIGAICVLSKSASAASPLDYGMEMAIRAHEGVCWYENLKQFPNTDSKGFNECHGQQKNVQNQIETNDFFKTRPEQKEPSFGSWSKMMAIGSLPKKYKEACEKYLEDSKAEPADNEGDALNDRGKSYPYKAYSYCLMHTLREAHGDKAIEAVKMEKTHSKKNWMQALLDRDNEFRARHSVGELQIAKELNEAAQKWADNMAAKCDSYHSKNTDSFRQWKNGGTGESLSAGGGEMDKDDAAYIASDGWYEEVQNYPFPEGYKDDDQELFKKIGHFTQSVWKSTKYVGYGFAKNPNCEGQGKSTWYIAARYSPPGNVKGKYQENVNPPKD